MKNSDASSSVESLYGDLINEIKKIKEYEIIDNTPESEEAYKRVATNCIKAITLHLSAPAFCFDGNPTDKCDNGECGDKLSDKVDIHTKKIKITNHEDEVIDLLVKTQEQVEALAKAFASHMTMTLHGSKPHDKIGDGAKVASKVGDLKRKLKKFKE